MPRALARHARLITCNGHTHGQPCDTDYHLLSSRQPFFQHIHHVEKPQTSRAGETKGRNRKGKDRHSQRGKQTLRAMTKRAKIRRHAEGTSGPANGPLSGQKEGASRRPGRPEGGRRRGPRAQVGLSQKAEENAPGNRKSLGWRRPTLGVGQGCDTNGRHAAGRHWDSQDAPRVAWDRRAPHPGHLSKEGPGHPARRPRFLNKKSDCS